MLAQSQHLRTQYHPEERGIQVIQKYVTTIPENQGSIDGSAHIGGVYDFEFVGAVGFKKGKAGKMSVHYHVYWRGFGPKDMTWEPESHISRDDLEVLWSNHGRVNRAGKISMKTGGNFVTVQPEMSDHTTVAPDDTSCGEPLSPGANADICREDTPPAWSMGNTCVLGAPEELEPSRKPECVLGLVSEDIAFPPGQCSSSCNQNTSRTPASIVSQPNHAHRELQRPDGEDALQCPDLAERNDKTLETSTPSIKKPDGCPETIAVDVRFTPSQDEVSSYKPQRKRRSYRRTKTGCLSCRARRKKCDEQKPSCRNCIRLQRKCEGYDQARRKVVRPPRFMTKNSSGMAPKLLANSRHPPLSIYMQPEDSIQRYSAVDSSQSSARHGYGYETLPHLAELNLPTAHHPNTRETILATAFRLVGIKLALHTHGPCQI